MASSIRPILKSGAALRQVVLSGAQAAAKAQTTTGAARAFSASASMLSVTHRN
ncbi:hypothetical protein GGH19_003466 [Coemansia sp. RSA 1807]|nr:hypothetical protein GGH19_003466 [Coemansia sp. RSA 1807]